MPRAPRHCPHPGCTTLIRSPQQRCPAHSGWATSPRTASAGRSGRRDFQALRSKVFQHDNWTCQLQLPGCLVLADQVDHITPVSQGGTDEMTTLRSVCARCHARRTASEAARPRWA
jgi:5-methylcytosine-specific restriction enzyme A